MKNLIKKIRSWPIEKKRIFSLSLAVFLTVIVIIFNSAIGLIWKNETKNRSDNANNPFKTIQDSFSEIINIAKPALEKAFSSSTENLSGTSTGTGQEIIDQNNLATSSLGTSTNVVR